MSNTEETTTNENAMRAVMLFSGHSAIGSLRTAISQSRITVGDLVNALSIVDPTTPVCICDTWTRTPEAVTAVRIVLRPIDWQKPTYYTDLLLKEQDK